MATIAFHFQLIAAVALGLLLLSHLTECANDDEGFDSTNNSGEQDSAYDENGAFFHQNITKRVFLHYVKGKMEPKILLLRIAFSLDIFLSFLYLIQSHTNSDHSYLLIKRLQ